MESAEMQMLSVWCLAPLQSPAVAVKSLVSRCCGALPLMMSAMLFHLPGCCEGITTSIEDGLVLQREVVKNSRHRSVLFVSARPNCLRRARFERSVNASSVFCKWEGISSSCSEGGDEMLLNTSRRTDPPGREGLRRSSWQKVMGLGCGLLGRVLCPTPAGFVTSKWCCSEALQPVPCAPRGLQTHRLISHRLPPGRQVSNDFLSPSRAGFEWLVRR